MPIGLTSPVTGSAQTGLTSPTYTNVAAAAPRPNSKQYAVTALGGTQTGVSANTMSNPFTITVTQPVAPRAVGRLNANGKLVNNGTNRWDVLVRKGMLPLAGQAHQLGTVRCIAEFPAGSDVADPASQRAALSFMIGALTQLSAALGDLTVDNVL